MSARLTRSGILKAVEEVPGWFWAGEPEEDLATMADLVGVEKWQLVHSPLRDFALEAIRTVEESS